MMKNSGARRFSKRCYTANPPPTGSTIINKIPKNRYFTNASRHSFCFFGGGNYRFVYIQNLPFSKFMWRISRLERILAKFTLQRYGGCE